VQDAETGEARADSEAMEGTVMGNKVNFYILKHWKDTDFGILEATFTAMMERQIAADKEIERLEGIIEDYKMGITVENSVGCCQ